MTNESFFVTLVPSTDWSNVSDHLNCPSGQYAMYAFLYVMKRNGIQQNGEVQINDNGNDVQMDHEWTIIPDGGDPGVEFQVTHSGGLRVLQYKTTGSGNAMMRFVIQFRFG